jgi:hypothetical protein
VSRHLTLAGVTIAITASTLGVAGIFAAPLLLAFVPSVTAWLSAIVVLGCIVAFAGLRRHPIEGGSGLAYVGMAVALASATLQLATAAGLIPAVDSLTGMLVFLVIEFAGAGLGLAGLNGTRRPAVA